MEVHVCYDAMPKVKLLATVCVSIILMAQATQSWYELCRVDWVSVSIMKNYTALQIFTTIGFSILAHIIIIEWIPLHDAHSAVA